MDAERTDDVAGHAGGAGRREPSPRRPAGSRKDRGRPWVLSVREDAQTRLRVRRAAAREGVTPSEWVRLRLGEALDAAERGAEAEAPFAGNGNGAGPNSLSAVSAQGPFGTDDGARGGGGPAS